MAENESENRRKTKKVRTWATFDLFGRCFCAILFNCLVGDVNLPTSIAVVLNYCNLNSKRLSVWQH